MNKVIKNFKEEKQKLKSGGIHIKPENKGKFTASAKRAGQSVQEHARSVLNDPNATPLQKKRANFARNAAKWHKQGGKAFHLGVSDSNKDAYLKKKYRMHQYGGEIINRSLIDGYIDWQRANSNFIRKRMELKQQQELQKLQLEQERTSSIIDGASSFIQNNIIPQVMTWATKKNGSPSNTNSGTSN